MDNYAAHLFTDAVQAEQERAGMRERYAATYEKRLREAFDGQARMFIRNCETAFIASHSENGWPYVQHRGGPAGFIKVTGPEQIGFADYQGNKQFITKGNLATDNKVTLILMDYPRRARLKLLGHATMIDAGDDPELAAKLGTTGEGPVERLTTIDVVAMDWNCPKYITPRYSQSEVETMLAPKMAQLDQQLQTLATRLQELGEDPATLLSTNEAPHE